MSLLETIAATVKPWNTLYAHSKAVSAGVTFVHIGSLLIGGGLAVESDFAALRTRAALIDERRRALHDLAIAHRPVIIALVLMTASGIALALADVETFLVSPVFWTKMTLFAGLLANGFVIMRTERALSADPAPPPRLWQRMTASAAASLALWLTTTLLGVILMGV